MNGLYKSGAAGSSRQKTTHYRQLRSADTKQIARVLSGVPISYAPEVDKDYAKTVEKLIKELPYNLCSSSLIHAFATADKGTGKVKPGLLCNLHKGLNPGLVYSIWDWVKHELDDTIGPFLYPILLCGTLTKSQEWKARQLEPVLRMYRPEFFEEAATPAGLQTVPALKWWFQENECPACMLARIGSDANVLVALLAGIVGHYSSRCIGKRDKIRSKRVAMLKYWLQLHKDGSERFEEAWDLGDELLRQHKACRRRGYTVQEEGTACAVGQEMTTAYSPYEPTYRPENPSNGGTTHAPSRHDSLIPVDISMTSSYPRIPSPVPTDSSSIVPIDICEPYIPLPGPHACPPSSMYTTPTVNHHAQATILDPPPIPTLRATLRSQVTLATNYRAPSVQSEAGHFSIASSFKSSDTECSFNRLPSYVSTATPTSPITINPLRPAALKLSNTVREAEREAHLLPHPSGGSMYAGYGLPSVWKGDSYDYDRAGAEVETPIQELFVNRFDISPPTTPPAGTPCGKRPNGEFDVSPPGTPATAPMLRHRDVGKKGPLTQMTEWSTLY